MSPFLLLNPADNVLVARASAPEGTPVALEGARSRSPA